MNLLVVLFILGFIFIGFSLTYAMGVPLRLEERVCFGGVVGSVAVSLIGFGVASLIGANGMMVLITVAVGFVVASPLIVFNRGAVKQEVSGFRERLKLSWKAKDSPKPLIGIVALSSVVTIRIMQNAFGTTQDGGISAGHLSVY